MYEEEEERGTNGIDENMGRQERTSMRYIRE